MNLDDEKFYTTDEVANILRLKPTTLRTWRREKRGPESLQIGKKILYSGKSILIFLKKARSVAA